MRVHFSRGTDWFIFFITQWNNANTLAAAARAVHKTKDEAKNIATRLRRKGIQLKSFRVTVDYDLLRGA